MLTYRKIQAEDDAQIAKIVRDNLEQFHLNIPGTAYFDPELDHLSAFYNSRPEERIYYVALDEEGRVAGGVGAARFVGMESCAELQKLYLKDSVKGKGYSKELIGLIVDWAGEMGYRRLYLETHTNLAVALKLYERMGFEQIEKPAAVVHSTMDRFYRKELL